MSNMDEWFDEFFGLQDYDQYDPFEEGDYEEEDPTQGDEIRTPWGGLVD